MTEREGTGEELVGDERLNPTEQESDGNREGAAGETNDEPAEGEGGQESV